MITKKIAILGAGNLGFAIAEGLIKSNTVDNKNLLLSELSDGRRTFLVDHNYNAIASNSDAVKKSEIIIIAVKPWQVNALLEEIQPSVEATIHIIASCVSGLYSGEIFRVLKTNVPIYRVMPNTAIGIKESVTFLSSFNSNEKNDKELSNLFEKLGKVFFINEELMPAATVLGSCATAYALRFLRASMEAGIEIGFAPQTAKVITAQVMKGAAELILQHDNHPEFEIDKVTTPKGSTISGLNEMEHHGFSAAVMQGIQASLAKITGGK